MLLGPSARGVVAARDQDHQLVVRTDPYLVPVDPGIDRPRLNDLAAPGLRQD
jgi:hypothetical protein